MKKPELSEKTAEPFVEQRQAGRLRR